jgi:cysteine synthase
MDQARKSLYAKLESKIGNTPLIKYTGDVSNNNSIYLKLECDNPFESHYDRVYLALFKHYEEEGKIKPGDKVLETTSGSAGVSFAGIGKYLGYACFVALPKGGEKARENAIIEQGAELILTNKEQYISGFPEFLKKFLHENKDYFFLNHSMGKGGVSNQITLNALKLIGNEIKEKIKVDYFIPAIGNGSSVLGPGQELDCKVIAFETFQSAVTYDKKYPGQYEKQFGILPGTLPRHQLPGTSFQGIDFPHINQALKTIIDEVVLVTSNTMENNYNTLTNKHTTLLHWDVNLPLVSKYGRTTKAGLVVALDLAKKESKKTIVILAYDKAKRYDN